MSQQLFTSLIVTGQDARTFLQGQLTCDIETLTRERPVLASVNSAQGRVQAVLKVLQRDEGIVLLVVSSMAERTLQRLRKYVLRAKVKIETANFEIAKDDEWFASESLLAQVRNGIPHVFPETHEAFVAQMLNLDILGGISFDKGCYTGQEIIARAHFRGAVKRRMFRFGVNQPPPPPGTRVLANGTHAGDIVYSAAVGNSSELLAVVSRSQVNAKLTIDGAPAAELERLALPYSQQHQDESAN